MRITGGSRVRVALVASTILVGGCGVKPVVLFSEVTGTVTQNGAPVAGALVKREYSWLYNETRGGDETRTDANGKFSLPQITGKSISVRFVPHEPRIQQVIRITVNDSTYDGWQLIKRNYDDNGELYGRRILLHCDLGAPMETTTLPERPDRGFHGICRLTE